jgi:membrane-associated protease RseP (regulator of RpoE activity)
MNSEVALITSGGLREGNSLLYALLKIVALGQFYPTQTQDVIINQMAFAGWLGLFVTALNLIPVGQLDGGHVLYSLFGPQAKRIYYPVLVGMVILALFSQMWLIWVIILMLIGRLYAPPLDDITPLDPRRRVMALVTLAIFVLVFVPIPFQQIQLEGESVPEETVQAPLMEDGVALTLGD